MCLTTCEYSIHYTCHDTFMQLQLILQVPECYKTVNCTVKTNVSQFETVNHTLATNSEVMFSLPTDQFAVVNVTFTNREGVEIVVQNYTISVWNYDSFINTSLRLCNTNYVWLHVSS